MLISDLIPYENNAKIHTKEQITAIAKSIKALGFKQPIVVTKEGVVIIGHGRLEAAKLLGLKECKQASIAPKGADYVPIAIAEDLTEGEVLTLRLADNRLNESAWNLELVTTDMQELNPEYQEITGFDMEELKTDFEPVEDQGEEKPIVKTKAVVCPKCNHEFEI